ncbi:PREDICTED: uncharacterized protein LOC109581954 isoform X2 [Amphimedon queenslandica]|uniref:PLAT domain-containing protein n=1 Tax=Amphimedon queenslandica TaxID=400682 RepID=A0A1X7UV53_AMPQE|nr:PREDICTED: uncharacterized protein LOC109581954 isoform X2 [Amphimedon queenslandica]|eukprot:XP_019852024.1 PREDICTED: uncharacterized protein LOC109581954 isoform X2 [Amphimedon queenslandica]
MEFHLLLLLLLVGGVFSAVPVTPDMKTFSSAIKGGSLPANTEKTLYEHSTGQAGVITEQWFTGGGAMNEDTRIRIYIDGETTASIDFMLLLAHGIGGTEATEKGNIPWGTKRIAHAADGGIYNTYRIPFANSFKVTATHPNGGAFWYIIRGVENYPLILGDLLLPKTTKLKLYKNVGIVLKPLDFIALVDVNSTAGAVFQVTLSADSPDFNYLQACMRVAIDDSNSTMFLSSGTEDFFLSAYYFDGGLYHLDNSGLTLKEGRGQMSAYKFFENDPLLFSKSIKLSWRCGESSDCPSDFPPPTSRSERLKDPPPPNNTTVTTYAWVYEWAM